MLIYHFRVQQSSDITSVHRKSLLFLLTQRLRYKCPTKFRSACIFTSCESFIEGKNRKKREKSQSLVLGSYELQRTYFCDLYFVQSDLHPKKSPNRWFFQWWNGNFQECIRNMSLSGEERVEGKEVVPRQMNDVIQWFFNLLAFLHGRQFWWKEEPDWSVFPFLFFFFWQVWVHGI